MNNIDTARFHQILGITQDSTHVLLDIGMIATLDSETVQAVATAIQNSGITTLYISFDFNEDGRHLEVIKNSISNSLLYRVRGLRCKIKGFIEGQGYDNSITRESLDSYGPKNLCQLHSLAVSVVGTNPIYDSPDTSFIIHMRQVLSKVREHLISRR